MPDPGSSGVEPIEEAPEQGESESADTGGEVVLEEMRDEAARLVKHPVDEIKRLEHVADEGESAATPLIVTVGIAIVILVILAVALAVILAVYYSS
jgi:CHASE3 domain sensor protein